MESSLELLVLNFAPSFSKREMHGRSYLVVPLSLVVPGVLNGSKGRLYYPPEEVAREPQSWNHMPIVIYHPADSSGNISARSPGVLDKQSVGYVFNAYYNGKLRAEGWFDEERTRTVDVRVYDAIVNGRAMELSTGLYTDNYPAPEGAVWNNKPYDFIAKNYRPDHLAILPDERGACSLEDGCGVNVVNSLTTNTTEDDEPQTLVSRFLDIVANLIQPRSKVTGRIKKPNAGTGSGAVHDAALAGSVVLAEYDRQLGDEANETNGFPEWAMSEAKWGKAKTEATKGYKDSPDYWAVVAHIYRSLGGEVGPRPAPDETNGVDDTQPQGETMGLQSNERKKLIDKLITNGCGCWKESDRDTLNAFKDDRLTALVGNMEKAAANELIANRVKTGFKFGKKLFRFDEAGAKFVANEFPPKKEDEEDVEEAEAAEEDEEEVKNKGKTKNNFPPKEEEEEEDEETMNKKKAPAANRQQTIKSWLDTAPPEIREVVANSLKQQRTEREGLINKIVANCGDPDRKKRLPASLAKVDTDTLRDLAANIKGNVGGNGNSEDADLDEIATYLGASPAPTSNTSAQDDPEDVLLPSVFNLKGRKVS